MEELYDVYHLNRLVAQSANKEEVEDITWMPGMFEGKEGHYCDYEVRKAKLSKAELAARMEHLRTEGAEQ